MATKKCFQSEESAVHELFTPKISVHILHTVPYTFPTMLARRFLLTIKSFYGWQSFPLFS